MATSPDGVAGAHDATVQAGGPAHDDLVARLEVEVAQADAAVERIEEKMVGWQQSLADAKDAAKAAHERLDEARG